MYSLSSIIFINLELKQSVYKFRTQHWLTLYHILPNSLKSGEKSIECMFCSSSIILVNLELKKCFEFKHSCCSFLTLSCPMTPWDSWRLLEIWWKIHWRHVRFIPHSSGRLRTWNGSCFQLQIFMWLMFYHILPNSLKSGKKPLKAHSVLPAWFWLTWNSKWVFPT